MFQLHYIADIMQNNCDYNLVEWERFAQSKKFEILTTSTTGVKPKNRPKSLYLSLQWFPSVFGHRLWTPGEPDDIENG